MKEVSPGQLQLFGFVGTNNSGDIGSTGTELYTGTELPHTPGHLNCPACLQDRAMHVRLIEPSMSFSEASESFLELQSGPTPNARYVKPRTLISQKEYASRLNVHFRYIPLNQIGNKDIREYQRKRLAGDGFYRRLGDKVISSPAGVNKVKQETEFLVRILKLAGCWGGALAQQYMKLQYQESDFVPALSVEQQERFLTIAASNPKWNVVWWYSLVALHTTFSSDEMRTIRQGDINLTYGILGVNRRHGKNHYRRREVSLTDGACCWAIERLLERAKKLGCIGPHLHLFPHRVARNHFDGHTPMGETGIRRPFEEVREAAGVPWFRVNGWRHTAITRLAESGVNIATIMARAGHISPRMTAHYTHITEASQRLEMQRAGLRKPPANLLEWQQSTRAM